MADRLFSVEMQNYARRCGQQHYFRSLVDRSATLSVFQRTEDDYNKRQMMEIKDILIGMGADGLSAPERRDMSRRPFS
jgi:hypothetical protein